MRGAVLIVSLLWTAAGLALAGLSGAAARAAQPGGAGEGRAGAVRIELEPEVVEVTPFYGGAVIEVRGTVPSCEGVVLKVVGEKKNISFDVKGRVGLLWLTVGKAEVSNVPALYCLAASSDIAGLCDDELRAELGLGLASVADAMEVRADGPAAEDIPRRVVELMVRKGAYRTDLPLELQPSEGGDSSVRARVPIDSAVPAGEYAAVLYCISQGRLVAEARSEFRIVRSGLMGFMADLAAGRPAEYGLLSVLVAMGAGVLMAELLGGRRGRAR